jgi:hypothetical protein
MTAVRNMMIIVAMLFAAAPAFAQNAPQHPASAPGGHPGMMSMGDERMMEMIAAHPEGWLAFLKTELKITDGQSAQWDAFAEVVRANARGMKDMHASMMGQFSHPAALPDQLALHEKMLAAHLDAERRLKSAVEPLYATFSNEQTKTADELMSPMGMM